MPQWKREFPDMPASDMPPIPEGFVDDSWHNDACPRFEHPGLGLRLWVNYADVAQREVEGAGRFLLLPIDDDAADALTIYEGEDFAEVEAAIRGWRPR